MLGPSRGASGASKSLSSSNNTESDGGAEIGNKSVSRSAREGLCAYESPPKKARQKMNVMNKI